MKETMPVVKHQQASQLLHNKFVVVLGDSIQRSVYKDLVLLLQKDKYLTSAQLKRKGEMSFEQDCLVEGGNLGEMHNGTQYREVRQFRADHHLVRFYFVTRIFSRYMQSILQDFRNGPKPDVVIVNSCIWDISRYSSKWTDEYRENLQHFFHELSVSLPKETLVIWSLTMPLGENIKGGFLVPEIAHKSSHLRFDVIEANFYSGTLADTYGLDVLDLHFLFRFSLQHRTSDGAHWNALAHRKITSLLLQHAAQAWGVIMNCPLVAVEHPDQQQTTEKATKPAGARKSARAPMHHFPPKTNHFFNMGTYPTPRPYSNFPPFDYFWNNNMQLPPYHFNAVTAYRPIAPPHPHLPLHRRHYDQWNFTGYVYNPPPRFDPYLEHHHQYVMRSRHARHHYAPYAPYRPSHYTRRGRDY